MIAYHLDRCGTLSAGQRICGFSSPNCFGLPELSQWGISEKNLFSGSPQVLSTSLIASHNLEVRAESFRKLNYPDAPSRLSSFYAVPKLEHFKFWKRIFCISPPARIFEVYYDRPCNAYDANHLRLSAIDLSLVPASENDYIQAVIKTERSLHHYWSHDFTDDPLPELLLTLPVTIGPVVSFDALP